MQGPWASLGGWGQSGSGMGNQWLGRSQTPNLAGMFGGMRAQPMFGGNASGLPPWLSGMQTQNAMMPSLGGGMSGLSGGMMPQSGMQAQPMTSAMPSASWGMRPPSWSAQPQPTPIQAAPAPAPAVTPMQPQPMPARPQPAAQRPVAPQLAMADDPALSMRRFMAANRR